MLEAKLCEVIYRLSDDFEAYLVPEIYLESTKMTPDGIDKMMRQFLLVQFRVEDVERTWKLNQTNLTLSG